MDPPDDWLPPNLPLARGRSAIGVQNNVALVMEQVEEAIKLKRDPLGEEKGGDMLDVPVGALALARQISGDGEPPQQVLSMIRAASIDLAKKIPDEGNDNELKAFEAADPSVVPLCPGPPDILPPLVPPGLPGPAIVPPPSVVVAPLVVEPLPPRPTDLECPLCGGCDGDEPEPEAKVEAKVIPPSSVGGSSSSLSPGAFSRDVPNPVAVVGLPVVSADRLRVLPLDCSHSICEVCFKRQLATGWTGARISFGFLNCALCAKQLSSKWESVVTMTLAPHIALREKVNAIAFKRFNEEGQLLLTEMIDKGKLTKDSTVAEKMVVAVATMAIYKCVDCSEPFCGGRISCAEEMDLDGSNMRCPACVWLRLAKETDLRCMTHGFRFAIFKCDSCCAVATWDCGWNHFCERCHSEAYNTKNYPCPGPEKCPLGMPHPKNLAANFGQSNDRNFVIPFVIGCMACVGYKEANPGCSRPSPKEMQWEVKSGSALKAISEKKDNEPVLVRRPGPPAKCSAVDKCKCAGFKPQKWQANKCHNCYHWQDAHSN